MANDGSLAGLMPGERTRIERILFDVLREHCAQRGLHEGDAVRGASDGNALVLVQLPDGRRVPCERDWARFVQVRRDPGGQ